MLLGLLLAAAAARALTCEAVMDAANGPGGEEAALPLIRAATQPFSDGDLRCFARRSASPRLMEAVRLHQWRQIAGSRDPAAVIALTERNAGHQSLPAQAVFFVAAEATEQSGTNGPFGTRPRVARGVTWADGTPFREDEFAIWLHLALPESRPLAPDAPADPDLAAILETTTTGGDVVRVRWEVVPLRPGVRAASGSLTFTTAPPRRGTAEALRRLGRPTTIAGAALALAGSGVALYTRHRFDSGQSTWESYPDDLALNVAAGSAAIAGGVLLGVSLVLPTPRSGQVELRVGVP